MTAAYAWIGAPWGKGTPVRLTMIGWANRHSGTYRAVSACTSSTTRVSTSGSVSGRTPWPRLKTWPGAARPSVEDPAHLGLDDLPRREQHGRVEVALHRLVRADPAGGHVQRRTPVDADHVGAGLAHRAEQLAGPDAEVDPRHARVGQPARARRSSAAARSGGSRPRTARRPTSRTAAPPTTPASIWTRRKVSVISASRAQRACHSSGSPYISALVLRVRPRRPALDQVAGQRERRAGEADQRGVAQLARRAAGPPRRRTRRRPGRAGAAAATSPRGADRLGDHRAGARHDVDGRRRPPRAAPRCR